MKLKDFKAMINNLPEQLDSADVIYGKSEFEFSDTHLEVDEATPTTDGKYIILSYMEPETGAVDINGEIHQVVVEDMHKF